MRASRKVTQHRIATAAAIGSNADGSGEERTSAQLPATMMIAPITGTTHAISSEDRDFSAVAVAIVASAAYAVSAQSGCSSGAHAASGGSACWRRTALLRWSERQVAAPTRTGAASAVLRPACGHSCGEGVAAMDLDRAPARVREQLAGLAVRRRAGRRRRPATV